jgi:pimeloyl-ACP methyl ester carboxylesterase
VKKAVVSGASIHPSKDDPQAVDWLQHVKAECGPNDKSGQDCWPRSIHDAYVRSAPDPKHWPVFLERVKAMWLAEPNMTKDDLAKIKAPALVVAGDHDAVATKETVEMFEGIGGAALWIVPESSHFVPIQRAQLFNDTTGAYLAEAGTTGSQ